MLRLHSRHGDGQLARLDEAPDGSTIICGMENITAGGKGHAMVQEQLENFCGRALGHVWCAWGEGGERLVEELVERSFEARKGE